MMRRAIAAAVATLGLLAGACGSGGLASRTRATPPPAEAATAPPAPERPDLALRVPVGCDSEAIPVSMGLTEARLSDVVALFGQVADLPVDCAACYELAVTGTIDSVP